MWRDLSATPPDRIFQVILETFLHAKPNQARGQVDCDILVYNIRKSRGGYMLKPGSKKEGRM